jgi:hypothetical protein
MYPFGTPAEKITNLKNVFPNIHLPFQNMPQQRSKIAMVICTSLVTCKYYQFTRWRRVYAIPRIVGAIESVIK